MPPSFQYDILEKSLKLLQAAKTFTVVFPLFKICCFYDNFYSRENLMKTFPSNAHTPKLIRKGRSFLKADIQSQK